MLQSEVVIVAAVM